MQTCSVRGPPARCPLPSSEKSPPCVGIARYGSVPAGGSASVTSAWSSSNGRVRRSARAVARGLRAWRGGVRGAVVHPVAVGAGARVTAVDRGLARAWSRCSSWRMRGREDLARAAVRRRPRAERRVRRVGVRPAPDRVGRGRRGAPEIGVHRIAVGRSCTLALTTKAYRRPRLQRQPLLRARAQRVGADVLFAPVVIVHTKPTGTAPLSVELEPLERLGSSASRSRPRR